MERANGSYHGRRPGETAAVLESIQAMAGDEDARVLLRGATILSMDPGVGDLLRGDVLVRGSRIEAVAADLSEPAGDAVATVDLGGMILIPGLVDGHRHCWQNQFRRVLCDVDDLDTYMASTHGGFALHYRPEDIYIGNLVSVVAALDSGVTSVLDFSHNSRSAAHSDAAFRAYGETGIRAVHTSAPPNAGEWDHQWPADVGRLDAEHAAGNDLVTVRMGIDMRPRPTPELVRAGREMGVAITIDGLMGPVSSEQVVSLAAADALGPDVSLVHCTDFTAAAWERIADSGARVTLAPTSDEQIGIADALPPVQEALDHGVTPSLSVDVEVALASDMFAQMRAILATQRMKVAARRYGGGSDPPAMIDTRDVLEFATLQGARDIGLGDVAGSITPGKQADLVAIRSEDLNNLPLNNAAGTVVLGTDSRNVDLVMVGGRIRKWCGELVGQDPSRLRDLAVESRDRILEEAGFEFDPLAPGKGWSQGSRGVTGRGQVDAEDADWGPTPEVAKRSAAS